MQKALFIALSLLVLYGGHAWADQTIQIRVSATILPRPCEFPDNCDPVPASTPTKVIVDNETISYVGSPPEVTRKDDLMTVKF